jgi:hypothetical protein
MDKIRSQQMFHEYDSVKLLKDLPNEHLSAGIEGIVLTVLDVQDLPLAYIVEFLDNDGKSLGWTTVKDEDLSAP